MLTASIHPPALACLNLTVGDVTHLHHTYGRQFVVTADGQVRTWSGYTFTADVASRPDLSGRDQRLDACVAELLRFSPGGGLFAVLNVYLQVIDGRRQHYFAYTGERRFVADQGCVSPRARRDSVATATRSGQRVRREPQLRGANAAAATTRGAGRTRPRVSGGLDAQQRQLLLALRDPLAQTRGAHR